MTEQEVLDLINLWIVANGNNEITADVLRPILEAMVQHPNDLIGNLSTLNTTDQSNLVSAINEIYNSLNNNTGIKLHEGLDDPNDTPPTTYNVADFYIQKDISNNPIQLWQYNGIEWRKAGDIYAESTAYQETRFDYVGSNSFTIPDKVQAIIVKKNGSSPLGNLEWNQLGNTITYTGGTLETDDFLLISGIYVNQSDAPMGGGVETVTDDGNGVVEIDNTDPLNPVAKFNGIIGDGVTIFGSGTALDPLYTSGGGGGATTFLGLTDTPSTYTGQGEKEVKVNSAETGLEFVKKTGMVWSQDLIVNLVHTGDTVNTHKYTVELPKKYLDGNGSVMFEVRGDKSATAATSRINTYFNTSDINTGEVGFAISEATANTNSLNPSIQRRVLFNPTTIQHSNTIPASTDFSSANGYKHQTSALVLKDNNFLRIYIQNGSSGVTTTIYGIAVKIYNND